MCIHMPKYTVTIFKFNLVSQREKHLVDMTTITDNDEIQLQDHWDILSLSRYTLYVPTAMRYMYIRFGTYAP